ncbi:hypothetical protein MMPV_004791 [Pyropia vietnamensis]
MVRLTAEMVRTAPQGLNCLGDWELDLRGRRLVDIAALAPTAGRYDAIDLSRNFLPSLAGFPPAPRLRHLHVPKNRIAAIGPGFAAAVPGLESLLLTDNVLASLDAARLSEELARLPRLTLLCLRGNPVTRTPNYRLAVIAALPAVRVLDFVRVRDAERRAARRFFGSAMAVDRGPGRPTVAAAAAAVGGGGGKGGRDAPTAAASALGGGGGGGSGGGAATSISAADRERLRQMIAAAETIEEVDALEAALKSGDVAAVLGRDGATTGTVTAADGTNGAAADVSVREGVGEEPNGGRGAASAASAPIRAVGEGERLSSAGADVARNGGKDGGGEAATSSGGEGEAMKDDDRGVGTNGVASDGSNVSG